MYIFFAGASLKIARNLIQATAMAKCWVPLLEKSRGHIAQEKLLKEVLGLNACNLSQTMRETSVDREIDAEDRQDLLDDYIVENLRLQDWVSFTDGAERMRQCQEIEGIWERLRPHFTRTREAQGFKPRLEAVRDVMRHLGTGTDGALEEALLELVESHHRLFTGYFQGLLEPFYTPWEDLAAGPKASLGPPALEEPPAREEPPFLVELPARIKPPAPMEVAAPAEAKPPISMEAETPVEAKDSVEAKASFEMPFLELPPLPEEKESAEPFPEPEEIPEIPETPAAPLSDPTDRLSQPPGGEDAPLMERPDPEEEATLPEGLLLPETPSPPEPVETLEPPAEPFNEKMFQIERPFPLGNPGSPRKVDPKKLAKVLEILLASDPTINLKPIFPAPLPPSPPPEESFESPDGEGSPEPPLAEAP